MRTVAKVLIAVAGLATAGTAVAGDTTRILHTEPYGAIVTREAGVLVFRGLPPTREVVVNPGGKTPLELKQGDVSQTRVMILTQEDYARSLGAKIVRLK